MTSAPPGPPTAAAEPGQIDIIDLTKKFGTFTAVDNLSFSVQPGRITGFLGPNGSGKTTTLRMLLGLISITSGQALIGGQSYRDLVSPTRTVGAALEATNFHPGRSGRDHLRVLAAAGQIPEARVDEMLEMVGIPAAAKQRAGGYSMGMRQRLGLAAALLGDPDVLILDEPANGLDPEGIRWLRGFLRSLADSGKTILVSSHMLHEIQNTVDDVVIIANGRLIGQTTMADLQAQQGTFVRTDKADVLAQSLQAKGLTSAKDGEGLRVETPDIERVGRMAFEAGCPVLELRRVSSDLEEEFLRMTEAPEHRNRNLATPESQSGGAA